MKQNQAPVVDKTLLLLAFLAGRKSGVTIGALVEQLNVPRSTVYRILNSLLAQRFVAKQDGGLFMLGPRLRELVGSGPLEQDWSWLTRIAAPAVQTLANRLNEAGKLSVREGDEVVTVYSVPSRAEYGLAVRVGHRAPLHVGGAGKAVMAYLPRPEIERLTGLPLQAFTPATITNPDTLREALTAIRAQGYSEDFGEMTAGIRSFAAPILDASGDAIAAISVPFIGEATPERAREMRNSVMATANQISSEAKMLRA